MATCLKSPNFLCKIESYRSVQKKVFPALLIGNLKWQLTFATFMEYGEEKMRLILECLNDSEKLSTSYFYVAVSYVYNDGSQYTLKSGTYNLKYREIYVWSDSITNFHKSFQMDNIHFLVMVTPAGKLENSFTIQKSFDEVNSESLCIRSLIEDFRKLFNNDENNDFELKCGEKRFYVHKAILSTQSEFFAGMFRSKMKEVNEGSGRIEDIEPDILELILVYMYTGDIPKISMESIQKVYAAADRLAMDPLKSKCLSLFIDNCITNVEEASEKETEKQVASDTDQTEVLETKLHHNHSLSLKEKKLLKDLFLSKEWRLYSQEFPLKSVEMCRPYLLQKY